MPLDLKLRRKWTFRAHGRQMVFIKKPFESEIHVLTKAFIWALYLPDYPFLSVEIKARNRYKPDVVQFDDEKEPVFWGEAGQVRLRKIRTLVRRYGSTHLVFAKWQINLEPFRRILEKETAGRRRSAPVDLISIPEDGDERFIRRDGTIRISFKNVRRLRY